MKTKRRILLRNGGRPLVLADAAATTGDQAQLPDNPDAYRVLGYRQTLKSAAKGGKANHNGFRFRNECMRALGRSFRGKVFIGGHEWGDPGQRGGDIVDAWAEEIAKAEIGIYYDLALTADWAIDGFAKKTIDRFSFGVIPSGEITCTIHEVPVWSTDECWCWPGLEIDGVIAEWEFEDGEGVELSAVNVPAVDGTGIVEPIEPVTAARGWMDYRELAALCGRQSRRASQAAVAVPNDGAPKGGAPKGGFTPAPVDRTIAESHAQPRGSQMDRALVCKNLGLPVTATDAEIEAKFAELNGAAAQMPVLRTQLEQSASELDTSRATALASHVEGEITRLKSTKQVVEKVIATLRAAADTGKGGSRAAFDQSLALVEASAADLAPIAGAARGELQSDKLPAASPGTADLAAEGPDAFELNKANPNMGRYMKVAGVTVDNVRMHGPRAFSVLPNLREIADKTAERGA